MIKPPGRNNQSSGPPPRPNKTSARAHAAAGFRSEPLRHEAERGWEQSDRSTAHGIQRRNKKAKAQKLRRQTSREKDALIAHLKEKVTRLEEELTKHLKPRKDD